MLLPSGESFKKIYKLLDTIFFYEDLSSGHSIHQPHIPISSVCASLHAHQICILICISFFYSLKNFRKYSF